MRLDDQEKRVRKKVIRVRHSGYFSSKPAVTTQLSKTLAAMHFTGLTLARCWSWQIGCWKLLWRRDQSGIRGHGNSAETLRLLLRPLSCFSCSAVARHRSIMIRRYVLAVKSMVIVSLRWRNLILPCPTSKIQNCKCFVSALKHLLLKWSWQTVRQLMCNKGNDNMRQEPKFCILLSLDVTVRHTAGSSSGWPVIVNEGTVFGLSSQCHRRDSA